MKQTVTLLLLLLTTSAALAKPNILWIYLEDQHPWYGTYGETLVPTPHIDALAREGVVFERAYVATPVCAPSRSANITGNYPIRIGVQDMRSGRVPYYQIHLPEGVRALPELFRDAGYATFNNGKDDYNFTYDRDALYSISRKWPDAMPNPARARAASSGGKGQSGGNKGQGTLAIGNWKGMPGRGVENWSDVPDGLPFFGQIGRRGGKGLSIVADAYNKAGVNPVDPADVSVPPQYPDLPGIRAEIASHLGTMVVTDNDVGDIVSRLKAAGHWQNTVIFLFSDHGSKLPRSKEFCYEEGLRVPLIVVAPGMRDVVKAGSRRSDTVSLMDVAATSLALAGLPIPEVMDSRNLFATDYRREYVFSSQDRMNNTIDRVRSVMGERFHYLRNFMTDRPLYQFGFREMHALEAQARGEEHYLNSMREMYEAGELTPAQALPYGPRPAEELYDLQSDPHEINNLAADPAYQEQLDSMRKVLAGWIESTGDMGQYPRSESAMREVIERFPTDWLRGPDFQNR